MDLGITGRRAIVCAASKGLGKGCAMALAGEGVAFTINARGTEALEATAEEIRQATGVKVTKVAVDITTPEGREATLAASPEPDILVNNSGGPPPGNFRDWGRDEWIKALDGNMLTAIELIRATIDGMTERAHPMHMRGLPFQVVEIDGDHWGRPKVQSHSQGADHPWPA